MYLENAVVNTSLGKHEAGGLFDCLDSQREAESLLNLVVQRPLGVARTREGDRRVS
ncbi:hypothetical protein DPMN_104305 [Dreissena polymorpha]|uniref:Uncharacterized protein n=1 Tax=Dreissena polymorpha TaxID=45954 RepID=A0A9D4HBC2_DREPO|nr:hypothetical protein DPMN_104305 [Dreissena polymorpha]